MLYLEDSFAFEEVGKKTIMEEIRTSVDIKEIYLAFHGSYLHQSKTSSLTYKDIDRHIGKIRYGS